VKLFVYLRIFRKGLILTLATTRLAHISLPLAAALALTLAGCSRQDAPNSSASPATKAALPAQPFEAVAAQGKGFTVGAMMAANTVYVLFDPQCPHCGRLWNASLPLHGKVKFVWVPVTLMNAKSGPQGAALLAAAEPAALMTEHEKSLLAGTGGISASASIAPALEQALKNNTALFNSLKVESVPYILARNQQTGNVVTHNGAMDTAGLGIFLGLAQP
jgi:thiol:disulfide interchange protein DsbG